MALPTAIGNCALLKELYLERTPLCALPPQLGQLGLLEFLHLTDSRIEKIPSEMGGCTSLRELLASTNRISESPEIGALRRLEKLDLTNNPFSPSPELLAFKPDSLTTCRLPHHDAHKTMIVLPRGANAPPPPVIPIRPRHEYHGTMPVLGPIDTATANHPKMAAVQGDATWVPLVLAKESAG